jgi:hypothetical protein
MPATIQNDILIPAILKHLKSKKSMPINFKFVNNRIDIQSSEEYIIDTVINGTYSHDMEGSCFSALITDSIVLLQNNLNQETKIIKENDEIVLFMQDNITLPYSISHDTRINISSDNIQNNGQINSNIIDNIISGFRLSINTSKILEVGVPSVIISNGRVYCLYSNTMIINDTSLLFSDIEIPYNTFNNINKNIDKGNIDLLTDNDKKLLILKSRNSIITCNYKIPNLDLINSINNLINSFSEYGTFRLFSLNNLELISKFFPKESLTISFYKDYTIGINITISDGKSIKIGTKNIDSIFNIILSTTQFDVLYKLFKDYNTIEVFKGSDTLCLKNNNKILILSGMIF